MYKTIGLIYLLATGTAYADTPKAEEKKIVRLEPVRIEGKIQKPEAFYVLSRANLDFGALELKQDLVSKIAESVNDPVFDVKK